MNALLRGRARRRIVTPARQPPDMVPRKHSESTIDDTDTMTANRQKQIKRLSYLAGHFCFMWWQNTVYRNRLLWI